MDKWTEEIRHILMREELMLIDGFIFVTSVCVTYGISRYFESGHSVCTNCN